MSKSPTAVMCQGLPGLKEPDSWLMQQGPVQVPDHNLIIPPFCAFNMTLVVQTATTSGLPGVSALLLQVPHFSTLRQSFQSPQSLESCLLETTLDAKKDTDDACSSQGGFVADAAAWGEL